MPDTPDTSVQLRALLFDADGGDRRIKEDAIELSSLSESQLLWIDLEDNKAGDAAPILERLLERLELDGADGELAQLGGKPRLRNYGDWFVVEVAAVECGKHLAFHGRGLALVCGENFVLSLHRGPLEILDELYERERGETRIGTLDAESFAASLLDWQVDSYLHAVSELEEAVDRLEVAILGRERYPECLPELSRMRRGASRLRRMLAPHRHVFGALARPDFRPDEDHASAERRFEALELRFERAMDAVEVARELVVGSFELYTSRSAQRTNDTMRVLTFVTVLLGTLAVVAGVLGMNFKAPLFDSGASGFWTALAAMGAFAAVAVVIARLKKWM
ncbi:MAG: CorA family divalent cation transporter [Pseudomonadota bacterium]|nr:CorA family divalent cation transporter [Pseudomonadota bacterium]